MGAEKEGGKRGREGKVRHDARRRDKSWQPPETSGHLA